MRVVQYTVRPFQIEDLDSAKPNFVYLESYERQSPLADFVFGELRNQWFELVPPIEILNDELRSGSAVIHDPSSNTRQFDYIWVPFHINADEYRELVEAAAGLPGQPFAYVEPPDYIRLPDEWSHWALCRLVSNADDPWTFFGQFSKSEIDGAIYLLADANIKFEVKEGISKTAAGWSGPFALWVHDEGVAQASALLVPYFASNERHDA